MLHMPPVQAKATTRRAAFVVACGLLAAAGCSDAPAQTGQAANNGPVIRNDGECGTQNLTASCTCPDKGNIPGRQICLFSVWSACDCIEAALQAGGAGVTSTDTDAAVGGGTAVASDPAGNSSATRFEWSRTPFALGSCKAGHYVGDFMGEYRSSVVFGFPVMVSGEPGADGAPGLEFWLEKTPGSGEIFSVNGGKLRGTANGEYPFTGDLTGTLDCATKKYVGRIENGVYLVGGLMYTFEGDVTADYDKLQNLFIGGKWLLVEPATGNPFIGGELDWSAAWSAM